MVYLSKRPLGPAELAVEKFNPNHDGRGRFAHGAGTAAARPGGVQGMTDDELLREPAGGKPAGTAWSKMGGYAPQPSALEAQNWAQEHYPKQRWDITKADTDGANAIVGEWHRGATAYPALTDWVQDIRVSASKDMPREAYGANMDFGRTLQFNPEWFGNSPKMRRQLKVDEDAGFHPKGCTTQEYVVDHELGHTVVFSYTMGTQTKGNAAYVVSPHQAEVVNWFQGEIKKPNVRPPSMYAATDIMEALAEGHADVHYGSQAGRFSRDWMDFVNTKRMGQHLYAGDMTATQFAASMRGKSTTDPGVSLREALRRYREVEKGLGGGCMWRFIRGHPVCIGGGGKGPAVSATAHATVGPEHPVVRKALTDSDYAYAPVHGHESKADAAKYRGKDAMLGDLMGAMGYTGKPHVLNRGEMDAYVRGGHAELWRGVPSLDKARDFARGDYKMARLGLFGAGTYAANGARGNEQARLYAGEGLKTHGAVLRMALKPDAKVVTAQALKTEYEGWARGLAKDAAAARARGDEVLARQLERMPETFKDQGRFATLRGYDAIHVPRVASDLDYTVILNRTAVVVQDEAQTVKALTEKGLAAAACNWVHIHGHPVCIGGKGGGKGQGEGPTVHNETTVERSPVLHSAMRNRDLTRSDDVWSKPLSTRHGDEFLNDLLEEKGALGRPHVLGKKELDEHVAAGEQEIWRGVSTPSRADQFKTGDYNMGRVGMFGNGTYAAATKEAAQVYAGKDGAILRMSLKPDARVGNVDQIKREHDAWHNEWGKKEQDAYNRGDKAKAEEISNLRAGLDDLGRFAAYKGYDAYNIPAKGYTVLLNRTAVRVQKEAVE